VLEEDERERAAAKRFTSEVGNELYRSPEQRTQYYNETTDVWSVGVMLVEMLGGKILSPETYDVIKLGRRRNDHTYEKAL